ncbi:MAG TPA: DUF2807 domain-containing protein [Puia sp.]|uniref:GIN domain-containing protein n=1 Tax=Puia sp. TaxID=2045100 RepID=UPI002CEB45BB|nr:DUF2807 domain-containing protein [Puia sp.]HVU94499.1 DUF2807 domain-containing protein [Puia sp.]
MKSIVTAGIVFLGVILSAGCGNTRHITKGNGTINLKEYELNGYDRLLSKVSGVVVLSKDAPEKVLIRADANVLAKITVAVVDGELNISPEKDAWLEPSKFIIILPAGRIKSIRTDHKNSLLVKDEADGGGKGISMGGRVKLMDAGGRSELAGGVRAVDAENAETAEVFQRHSVLIKNPANFQRRLVVTDPGGGSYHIAVDAASTRNESLPAGAKIYKARFLWQWTSPLLEVKASDSTQVYSF